MKKSFSLIELSIVILVIGIIFAAIVKGSTITKKANLSKAQSLTANSSVVVTNGLTLWLEATMDDSFNVIKSDGDAIDRWVDRNPITRTSPSQSAADNKPKFYSNEINELPGIKFDGDDDWLEFDDSNILSFEKTDPFTLIFVAKLPATSNAGKVFMSNMTSEVGWEIEYNKITNLSIHVRMHIANPTTSTTSLSADALSIFAANKPFIGTMTYTGSKTPAGITFYLNGSSYPLGNGGDITQVSGCSGNPSCSMKNSSNFRIGTRPGGGSNYFDGSIGEIIIFKKVLSSSDKKNIEGYLGKKWNIPVK